MDPAGCVREHPLAPYGHPCALGTLPWHLRPQAPLAPWLYRGVGFVVAEPIVGVVFGGSAVFRPISNPMKPDAKYR